MLKSLVALLIVANLGFFAWSQGVFDGSIGASAWRSTGDREPERLRRQVRPEQIRLLSADAVGAASTAASTAPTAASSASTSASAAAPAPFACLEAGPFAGGPELDAALAAARNAAGPSGVELLRDEPSAAWGVYMGRYATPGAMARKEDELKRRGVDFEELTAPEALAPGLVLGRFTDRAAAERALVERVGQGVRNLRVVALGASSPGGRLRVAQADAAVTARLYALADDPALAGKRFSNCATPP